MTTAYDQAMSALDEMLAEGGTAARLAEEILSIENDYRNGAMSAEDRQALLEEIILIKAANDRMLNEILVRRLVDIGRVITAVA